jgi:hypothetical protein
VTGLTAARVGSAWAAAEPVWALVADNAGVQADAAQALLTDWRAIHKDRELQIHTVKDWPTSGQPSALVTLGSAALRAALERLEAQPGWARVPAIAALVPREGVPESWKHATGPLTAAYLDQPFERYLDLIRLALPRLSKVGVLVGPEAALNSPAMFKAANDRGMHLSVGRVTHPDGMHNALRAVLAECDVLLVLPDSSVASSAGLQHMLASAYRQRTPVVAYSPALVKAGAALGLYASPAQVGRQVAQMLHAMLYGAGRPAPRLAEGVTVAVNEQVCRSLGLDVPDGDTLAEAIRR